MSGAAAGAHEVPKARSRGQTPGRVRRAALHATAAEVLGCPEWRERLGFGGREGCLGEASRHRLEAVARAAPTPHRLEVADDLAAPCGATADIDADVFRARVAAPVAERRILASRAEFERRSGTREDTPAVAALPKHRMGIGRRIRPLEVSIDGS